MLKPTRHQKYPQYIIYPDGKVFSERMNRFCKIGHHGAGYNRVFINCIAMSLHRVVAETFISNPENKPCVNHIDGNKENNTVENLEWCTHKENTAHMIEILDKHKRGEKSNLSKLAEKDIFKIKDLIQENILSQREIASIFNVGQAAISKIKKGETWSHLKVESKIKHIKKINQSGSRNPFSKLNENDVIKIKKMLSDNNLSQSQIGDIFGVKSGTIYSIKTERTWKHI